MKFITLCSLAVVVSASMAGASAGAARPALADVLARAAKAAAAFADPTRVIYCEERYKPLRYRFTGGGLQDREMLEAYPWTAEFAIAATPDLEHLGFPWWELRDIRMLDGKARPAAVPGLDGLLTQPASSLLVQFNGLKGRPESSGSGPYERAVMVPLVAALYLHASNQARFTFKDSTRYLDETTRKLDFKARTTPTLLESPVGLLIMPTSGSLWVDQITGTVRKALLRVEGFDKRRRRDWMLITYGADGATGLWLPKSMDHKTEDDDPTVEGHSEYRNCRAVPRTAK